MKAELAPAAELYCSACEQMYATGTGEVCPRDGTRLVKLVGAHDPFLGRDLDGRYVILDKLGQGGMGAVYRGNQRSVDRAVAIKVVSPQLMSEPEMIKRFLREARLASRINHPNAVAVLDFGQTADGVFYLVMELVAGRTLEAILRQERSLDAERTASIGAQICHALEGAHAVPIVHRDLKPANVIVDANGLVKVLDFGIAKSLSPDTISSTMTNAGAIMGTPGFMPPEIGLGRPCDERSDLYSLGCILYVAVSGRLPFEADALPEIMMKHAVAPVPPLVDVPPGLAAVILRLLEKDPADRYQTATEVRLALEATIQGARATPTPWVDSNPPRRADRRPAEPHPAHAVALDAPTVARRDPGVPVRASVPPTRRRAWPWLLAVAIAVGGAAAVIALDPFGAAKGPIAAPASPPIAAPASPPIAPPVDPTPPRGEPPPSAAAAAPITPPVEPTLPVVVDPPTGPGEVATPPISTEPSPPIGELAPTKPATRPKAKQATRPKVKPAAKPATKPPTKPAVAPEAPPPF